VPGHPTSPDFNILFNHRRLYPQVVVICGRNRALLQRLQARVWPGATRVVAVGFVDNIHEWMGAVDAIITKAGPGTIAEALISGLPILLNGNIPCQVRGVDGWGGGQEGSGGQVHRAGAGAVRRAGFVCAGGHSIMSHTWVVEIETVACSCLLQCKQPGC
jgi:hypothetical protein